MLKGGAGWLAGLAVAVLLAMGGYHLVAANTAYHLTIPFPSAAGLYPGSDVLIAGAHAGSVDDITLDGDQVLVTITLSPAYAPVHSDASASLRPKSLLGEKYVALDPGQASGTLSSNSKLAPDQVTAAVDLQDVINTFDQPTRQKLQTLVTELGGGLAGRGQETNQTFQYGTRDLNDLAQVADTLARRDADLQQSIVSLNQVTTELSQSPQSQNLGYLLQNSQTLLSDLNAQDAQLRTALKSANQALARSNAGLAGTAPSLHDIFVQAPTLVNQANLLTTDLGQGIATLQTTPAGSQQTLLQELLAGIDEGPVVFGGRDGNGFATRVQVIFGSGSSGQGASAAAASPGGAPDSAPPSSSPFSQLLQSILGATQ